ncbi:glutaminase A [Photobacterium nomapromontoriensis]|uniref:glutaminase A n=1 Tax=Photobacterium nomapromontoriensis TaxID=2910237 RepID=UPI003D129C80
MSQIDTEIAKAIDEAFATHREKTEGQNAVYIPFLASVPADLTGLAFVSTQGEIYTAGDAEYPFAIESISKVLTLALALEQSGADELHAKVGAEPTGLGFNSVMALELHQGKPLTPLVNAGAISTVSLIKAADKEARWQAILNYQSRLMGAKIALSDEVNQSEQATNSHNQAISLLLKSSERIYSDALEACDVYTRQCSTLVTSVQLATMGATLANGGFNPITKEQVVSQHNVPHILAEMMMEGLYESSGDWAYDVGLPGKSGVGGGLIAVIPNVGGIAAFAPPLDECGNSVKGQRMIKQVAKTLGWNIFNCSPST